MDRCGQKATWDTEVLKPVQPGQRTWGAPAKQDKHWGERGGRPWHATVDIFDLYHKDNGKLLKCFNREVRSDLHFFF